MFAWTISCRENNHNFTIILLSLQRKKNSTVPAQMYTGNISIYSHILNHSNHHHYHRQNYLHQWLPAIQTYVPMILYIRPSPWLLLLVFHFTPNLACLDASSKTTFIFFCHNLPLIISFQISAAFWLLTTAKKKKNLSTRTLLLPTGSLLTLFFLVYLHH